MALKNVLQTHLIKEAVGRSVSGEELPTEHIFEQLKMGDWVVNNTLDVVWVSLLFFLCALLEEDFPEYFLLLLVRVIVLHVIVMGLVKHKVVVVIAVRVLVSNSA